MPHCSVEMKIINFIKEQRVIRKILVHLNLWDTPEMARPPLRVGQISQAPIQYEEHNRYEPFDDGWPGREKPSFICD
jgi:hypothetical protein